MMWRFPRFHSIVISLAATLLLVLALLEARSTGQAIRTSVNNVVASNHSYVPPPQYKELLGTPEASKSIKDARSYDPDFCHNGGDPNKAIVLYQHAISLQPDAAVNTVLFNRLAQLYAFNTSDGSPPDPRRAAQWWSKAVASTNRKQLLWIQSHMGRACALTRIGSRSEAMQELKEAMDANIDELELPQWLDIPESHKANALSQFKSDASTAQMQAVDLLFYIGLRDGLAVGVAAMNDIERTYPGTPVSVRAKQLLADKVRALIGDPYGMDDMNMGPLSGSTQMATSALVTREPANTTSTGHNRAPAAGSMQSIGLLMAVALACFITGVYGLVRRRTHGRKGG